MYDSRPPEMPDRPGDHPGWDGPVPDPVITCVDCGGDAYLLTHPHEDGRFLPGEIVAYRCRDCLDRWDLVLPDEPEY